MLVSCDAPRHAQYGFQDAGSSVMLAIIALHHELAYVLLFVLLLVMYMLGRALWSGSAAVAPRYIVANTMLELVWTIVPAVILLLVAMPSFALLYSIDELVMPGLTIKAIGNQWYWSYEYADYAATAGQAPLPSSMVFESYMLGSSDAGLGALRLLEVDNAMVLPVLVHTRLLVTSTDVLHSWAVPALGIKCDAVPGRLNQAGILVLREGCYYGQCSEICGLQHGFMPIMVEAVTPGWFRQWLVARLVEEVI
nr:cytochrome c oxidase subunit II [Bangiopsis subsimplex]